MIANRVPSAPTFVIAALAVAATLAFTAFGRTRPSHHHFVRAAPPCSCTQSRYPVIVTGEWTGDVQFIAYPQHTVIEVVSARPVARLWRPIMHPAAVRVGSVGHPRAPRAPMVGAATRP